MREIQQSCLASEDFEIIQYAYTVYILYIHISINLIYTYSVACYSILLRYLTLLYLISLYCNLYYSTSSSVQKKNHSGKILHEAPLTKARMGVALMKAVPLVSFLVVLRRAWRLDQIMVKNRRRGNRGNPWGNLERNCYMRHVHDSDWFDMIWNDGFWPASCFWHSFHHFKHALACFGYSSCLSTMKTETENRFFFFTTICFLLKTSWKRDMGWFGSGKVAPLDLDTLRLWDVDFCGAAFLHLFQAAVWEDASRLQSLLVLRRWCFVYKT